MRELFIDELDQVQGGIGSPHPCKKCCHPTTLACCEEGECSGCCI